MPRRLPSRLPPPLQCRRSLRRLQHRQTPASRRLSQQRPRRPRPRRQQLRLQLRLRLLGPLPARLAKPQPRLRQPSPSPSMQCQPRPRASRNRRKQLHLAMRHLRVPSCTDVNLHGLSGMSSLLSTPRMLADGDPTRMCEARHGCGGAGLRAVLSLSLSLSLSLAVSLALPLDFNA
jgi:hypothetical protein